MSLVDIIIVIIFTIIGFALAKVIIDDEKEDEKEDN